MIWQDPLAAALLAFGLGATWRMALDARTRVPRGASLLKGAASLGLGVLQASLGLWWTAATSAAYTVAFLVLAARRAAPRREVP